VHFEIHADDVQRAIRFYSDVFGWAFPEWFPGEYWGVMTAEEGSSEPGINGGLLNRQGPGPAADQPVSAFVCTVQVDDLDECLQRVATAGGKTVVEKHALAGLAWQAYCTDTEGNIFGLHQPDESAQ
jgi:predicted enzyme related to lactoylglutathione lyase